MAGRGRGRGTGRGSGEGNDQPELSHMIGALAQSSQEMQQMFMQFMQGQHQNVQANQYDPIARLSFGFGKGVTKRYDGSVNPEKMADYFRDMEKNFSNVNVPEQYKVRLAEHYLERDADSWWQVARGDAILKPEFGWDLFKELLEERFFPQALRDRKEREFLALRQGSMSVQAYTDVFNRLAHFASDILYDDRQRVKFYKMGLSARLQHAIQEETAFTRVYSKALRCEYDFEAIRREDEMEVRRSAKRAYTPEDSHEHFQEKKQQVGGSGDQRIDQGKKGEFCRRCKKPYHPGKGCDGTPRACFNCGGVGHFARDCSEKKAISTSVVTPKHKGKIYVMSRADAEAHPEIRIGMFRVSFVPVIFS
jgi:hypothetical protein